MATQAVGKTIQKMINPVRQAVPRNEKGKINFAPVKRSKFVLVDCDKAFKRSTEFAKMMDMAEEYLKKVDYSYG